MRSPRPSALAIAVLVVAASLIGATAAEAAPRRKPAVAPVSYKVRIESEPTGASVYLGDHESGPAGVTPLELMLPAGEHVVILELDGHVPRFENLIVEGLTGDAAGLTQSHAFALAPATAMLVVSMADGEAAPAGTQVTIDGKKAGGLPVRLEVEVGAHQVLVTAPGRAPFETWVEVEGGQEHVMTVAGASLGTVAIAPRPRPARAVGPIGLARAGLEFGWRKFRYDSPRTANLRPFDAAGTVHLVVDLELHPWRRMVASRVLDRLSLTGGAGWSPPITARDMIGTEIDAYWRSQHAGLRFRAAALPRLAVDVDAGWMHLLYTFRDRNNLLVDEVPDVDYHMLRIGARVVGRFAPIEAWLGVENRLVVSAGELETRFRGAEIDGVGARAGAAMWMLDHHLEARIEGQVTRFGWTFRSEAGDRYDAAGGSDLLYGVTLSVGGAY